MPSSALCLLLLLFLLHVTSGFIPLCAASSGVGFSVELIHRDNPKSPLYDPSSTPSDRVMAAARHSRLRAQQITAAAAGGRSSSAVFSVDADIIPNLNSYLIRYEVGTPPFEVHGTLDTGSDLVWTNCKPCTRCYPQDAPLFDPASSSTHQNITCDAPTCKALSSSRCGDQSACLYHYAYSDGTNNDGVLAWESLALATTEGGPATFPKFPFGCAFQSTAVGANGKAAGIVGMSPGPLSLISQLGSSVGGKFSYCFPAIDKPEAVAKVNFGDAVVYPASAVITPMVPNNAFYMVNLVDIVVGDKTISVPAAAAGRGNIIVDSGTTLTLLEPGVLQQVVDAVAGLVKFPRKAHSALDVFAVCFGDQGLPGDDYPVITFKFDGGASVAMAPASAFVKSGLDAVCLAMGPAANSNSQFFGNLAQQNMLVIHDIGQHKMAFAPTDCGNA